MDDRASKFRKFLEDLPRLCSPTICGTLSQPTTKAEHHTNKKNPDKFEWSLEQKAILSPANITMATCSDIGDMDHSFLHQESEQFFSQKIIAPSPMTTPSTRNYSRSQPAPKRHFQNHMFDERDEDTDSDNTDDELEDEDTDEGGDGDASDPDVNPAAQRVRRRPANVSSNSDTDIDMDVLQDDDDDDDDDDETDRTTDDSASEMEDTDQDDDMTDEYEDDDDDDDDHHGMAKQQLHRQQEDMDNLFLSPPMRSSQTQQRVDIFSPGTFGRVMEDENTLQSTPKTIGSQISRTRTRRGSGEMYD